MLSRRVLPLDRVADLSGLDQLLSTWDIVVTTPHNSGQRGPCGTLTWREAQSPT